MVTIESMVSITFRVINLGTLAGLGVYFFRKYAWDMIMQQIAQKRAYIQNLHKQEKMLEQEKKTVEKAIKDDEKDCIQLKEKINHWRVFVAQESGDREQQKEQRIRVLQKEAKKRTQEVTTMRLADLVLPHALDTACNELQKKFTDEQVANQFVKHIVDYLRVGKQ